MIPTKRYFALFGPKASGKTVFLGALYGSGADPEENGLPFHVAASEDADDPTHAYLGKIFRTLRSATWPDATAFERLEKMTFRFTCGDLARDVVLPDVAGELTQRAVDAADLETLAVELKKKILAEYADYHGFLIFVPADAVDSSRPWEYKSEVDALLNALREKTPDGGTIARPFAVLVTKWDLVEPGPLTEVSETRATVFFEESHRELACGLKLLCKNLRVFPVSATGPTVVGLPSRPLQPTNLGAPVAWLIETYERVILDLVVAYIERNKKCLFRSDPDSDQRETCLKVAHRRLAEFLEDVPHGPLAEEARAHDDELRALRRARIVRRARIAMAVLGILVLVLLGYRDSVACTKAMALLNNSDPKLSAREVIAQVDPVARGSFLTRPVGYMLFWWPRLRRDFEKYRGDYECRFFEELRSRFRPIDERDARDLLRRIDEYLKDFPDSPHYAEIGDFRKLAEQVARYGEENRRRADIEQDYKVFQSHPDDCELAENLVSKCESFLKDLPASRHLESIQRTRAEAQGAVRTCDRAKDYEELLANLSKAAAAPLRCHQLCAQFLSKDPSHPKGDEIRRKRDGYLCQADDQAWAEVKNFAHNYPVLFREQIEKADAYLTNALFTAHKGEASHFKRDQIKGYDKWTYEAIRERARQGNHAATLLAVGKLCREYLTAPISSQMMATDVQHWLDWFDGWTAGKELHVRVATIRIDRQSIWHHSWWHLPDPLVHVIVKVGPRSDRTSPKSIPLGRDIRDLPKDRLGPFTWKWGDPEVSVTLHHKGGSPEDLPADFNAGGPFKLRYLDGPVMLDGGKIVVRLECPEVIPPVLPPYKEN